MEKPAILIAQRGQALPQKLKGLLFRRGLETIESSDDDSALQSLRNRKPVLVIVGSSRDAACDQLEVARQIRRWDTRVPLILITSNSSEELAIAALRAGINDYLREPVSLEEMDAAISRCLADPFAAESSAKIETTSFGLIECQKMIGESPLMLKIKAYLVKVASADSSVLITGETGTGKELAAELIYRNSARHKRPFVSINCAAIPETLVESELFGYERGAFTGAHSLCEGKLKVASGGTVFFDEIGDMSPNAQAKILRLIETKEMHRLGANRSIHLDFRIIAATNRDLARLVAEGKFRQDLYFRINVATIHLPPLRDRKEDILPLSCHYIRELNHRFQQEVDGFNEEALENLLHYDWPGNVRELKNLLEATFVNVPSRRICFIELPEQFRRQLRDAKAFRYDERERLLSALFTTNWNKSEAALKLRWSRSTLYRKLARHNINASNDPARKGVPSCPTV